MTRLPVYCLLVGTVGATLALTSACGGGDTPNDTGGSSGTGGAAPTGGSSGAGAGTTGGTAGGGSGNCSAVGTATASENIGTVFNVTVTTDLPGFDGGQIDFGLDTGYGYTAPIEMAGGPTTLLGMKQNRTYHYRVTAKAGAMTCVGQDQTLETTGLLTGFPQATIDPMTTPSSSAGGFMISEFYAGMRQVPFILDKDLDMVWAYDTKIGQAARARMSIDGKFMWVARSNVPNMKASMSKIAMDGSSEVDLSDKFPRMNHDFTIIDDANQTMYFIAYQNEKATEDATKDCDDIVEYDPVTDVTRTVMSAHDAFPSGPCHCNAIQWSPTDDSLVVSDLDHAGLFKIDRKTGAVKWVLNGGADNNDFTGDGSTWSGPEHNFHLIAPDHLVLFNNVVGSGIMPPADATSLAIEIKLDEAAKTATKLWTYAPATPIQNAIMGDVQRMGNGNTFVAYSTRGVVQEVDAAGALIRSIGWASGGAIGHIIMRPTLYGKPPR